MALKLPGKRRSKFGNVKARIDGYLFDSQHEASRYLQLKGLTQQGKIRSLVCHPKYPVEINGHKVCTYIGDFQYWDLARGAYVTEDAKSEITRKNPLYRLKKKLVRAVLGIDIVEV